MDTALYETFDRDEWRARRAATPLTLDAADLDELRGLNERLDLEEVESVYLPLTRYVNLHVAARRSRQAATDEADRAGAFAEDALSEGDALASTDDLADLAGDGSLEPAFLDDDGPSADLPRIVSTTNARKLYELRPGESVAQAAARKAKEG